MKSYEEITETLLQRRDKYVEQQKRRKTMTKRIIALASLCLALLIGVAAWRLDFFKTKPADIDSPESDISSNQEVESSQSEVSSQSGETLTPIEQSVPSAQDIPTEIGGGDSWWYNWVYEYKFTESSYSYLNLVLEQEDLNKWHNQFWNVNKETYTRFENVGIIGAIDELGITKEQFVSAISEKGATHDGRYYYEFSYVEAPIDDSFAAYERYWYLTQEEVNLIFSPDKELRDEKCRSRYTAFANGKIYTPHWICSHTAEDYIAAGLTKQQLIDTISTWNNVGTPIVVEDNGEVWSDRERFMTVIDFVKAEIDKMP